MVPEVLRRPGLRWRGASPARRRTVRFVAVSTLAGVVAAAGAVSAAGPWEAGQRRAERVRAASAPRPSAGRDDDRPPAAAPVLAAPAGPPATAAGVTAVLQPLLADPALGERHSAEVIDVLSGERLLALDADGAYTPASTVKLATAAAALAALGPDHRIDTTVVESPEGIVLVGGGDPTLTAHPGGPWAGLPELAEATARELRARGVDHTRVAYDLSRYSGPVLHEIGPNDNLAPVTALMADEGRLDDSDHGPAARSADPAGDAARTFARLLADRGVRVDGEVTEGRAATGARRLAAVSSPPLSALVERALTNSDNDIAEALARQTALAGGRPAGFDGAGQATAARLAALGLPTAGLHLADGSGLDRGDRVSADFLAHLLALAAAPAHPELRPLLTGLPVAGFSGTLRDRYPAAAARGLVRAKTGTLTGVNTLAGTVVSADGRLLAFAFLADGTRDAEAAQRALDALASAVAGCGCSRAG
ncbi:D-alanyl-D-alanine carboxypeptidase/D-alanyl-D-alanine endopeptidase [Streptomyces orinoci]|uniref:D-alanyl-D-alanine carboxypeptidase/D-alanyl-D-alanine-endopeptidase n=1 Tax=Streptomyces orinoci TaxID=67339 RepID=A0ABV3JXH7_STRON|nr:D-alanyl-D-alanine carboxypeptidase/D-alanyl-D-alanine-endopeptidase [Streptomyces orinoci]